MFLTTNNNGDLSQLQAHSWITSGGIKGPCYKMRGLATLQDESVSDSQLHIMWFQNPSSCELLFGEWTIFEGIRDIRKRNVKYTSWNSRLTGIQKSVAGLRMRTSLAGLFPLDSGF